MSNDKKKPPMANMPPAEGMPEAAPHVQLAVQSIILSQKALGVTNGRDVVVTGFIAGMTIGLYTPGWAFDRVRASMRVDEARADEMCREMAQMLTAAVDEQYAAFERQALEALGGD